MSMKKRLRKAYENATPNVLDRVLQACPEQTNVPPQKDRKKLPHWITETLATAAAFALLIGLVGGGIWYAKNKSFSAGGTATNPTDSSTSQPESTGPDKIMIRDYSACLAHARSLLCDDPEIRDTLSATFSYLYDTDGAAILRLEISYEGYCYYFEYECATSELMGLGVITCDCIKEGYISPKVVLEKLRLEYAINYSDTALVELTELNGVTQYAVSPGIAYSIIYYVNPYNGELYNDGDSPKDADLISLRDQALEYVGLAMDDVLRLQIDASDSASYIYIDTETSLYTVVVFGDGTVLGYPPADNQYVYWTDVLTWRQARDIALEDFGFTLDELVYINISYNSSSCLYDCGFQISTDATTAYLTQVRAYINYPGTDTFNDSFADLGSWYNMALTSTYESPEELDLYRFFYNGFDGENTPTDEEWAALKDMDGFDENFDFFRLPAEKMDEVLMQYFGITTADVQNTKTWGLVYLESTDCYYMMHTDFECFEDFFVHSIEYQSDDTILITYSGSLANAIYRLHLKPTDDGYQILSNTLATN